MTLPLSYFSEPDRVLILHIAKAAGTSLLWRIFAANGLDAEEIAGNTAHPEVAWDQALWSRTQLVLLNSVSEKDRYEYLVDPSILKIAFVRNPASRLWSAWVSKVLTGEPAYADVRDHLYGPFDSLSINIGATRKDLADRFVAFVNWLPSSALFSEDGHFMPQAQLLDGAPSDTEILDVINMNEHLDGLVPSLAAIPATRRRNVTQELIRGPVMSQETYASIARLYDDDFALWGSRFAWEYQSAWDVQLPMTGSPVSEAFVERARAARRLTAIWKSMDTLRSERDTAVAELQASLASRTWRWSSAWRRVRKQRSASRP